MIKECHDSSAHSVEDILRRMSKIQDTMNLIVRGTKSEKRQSYLKALWACYDILPAYVHPRDPMRCNFEDKDSYDGYSMLKELGDAIALILSDGCEEPRLYHNQTMNVVQILDGDSKYFSSIFSKPAVLFISSFLYRAFFRYCH